jgi:hypothetical protein
MKRNIGTVVLFALLVLTAAALTKVDAPKATAIGSIGENKQHAN